MCDIITHYLHIITHWEVNKSGGWAGLARLNKHLTDT